MPSTDRDAILQAIGPCGLHCGGCLAFAQGPIREHAERLRSLLGENFGAYAERFQHMNPVFANYPAFAALLELLSQGSCHGCREGGCLFKECAVPSCARERGVDFCHQCAVFPCDRHGFPEPLAQRWRKNNEIMREKGLEAFHQLVKDRPRYP